MVPTQVIPAVSSTIRPIVLCIFRRNHSILVAEGYDPEKQESFYRPLGGGVEFGEYSWDAVRREIREELDQEIQNLMFIGPAENIFEYNGKMAHELIFIFEAEFLSPEPYKHDVIYGQEEDSTPIKAVWKPISDFKRKKARLYPSTLLDMIMG